ncbi:TPA: hypothetical protein CPT82_01710 [Candidatus Gastranaerophilales bacterium HUM_2]|jgi:signal transduction histidine kinase|nr:MAG TPA: hypothetical protein CPT82_01710 [Candidatus Gastranaerophilales bacterium HUM_2]
MNDLIKEQSRCIAHEMRNHISICELYTQIIKKNLEKEGIQNTSLNNALNCINKSLKIMSNSLLDLKSLDNFNLKKVNIKKVLEEGIKLATAYISDKKIKITSNINIDAEVFIDENKFLACIVNIIKNAIEAIKKEGKINVSLEIEGDYIHIKISNDGEPISQEKQKSIFEEGFTTKPTGSGLGLHICANNLKAQNATLKLTKSTTEITEFEIILPIV